MWLYLVALVALYHIVRWYRERQIVDQLQDKYVFITGCDIGFGNLLARQLDLKGLRVLAACLTEKGAERLKAQTSDRLETVILDVTKSDNVAAVTQWVKDHIGDKGLWGLVNNAGISDPSAPNEWLFKEDFMKILDVNLLGLIEVTLSLMPLIRKAKGRVVNISSIGGRVALIGGGYCISKFGLEAFSDTLRRELSFFGVKVIVVQPGYFKTYLTDIENLSQSSQYAWDHASEEIKEAYGKNYLANTLKLQKLLAPYLSQDLSLATNCMEHALTACHPRTRYVAGWDAKLFFFPLSHLPTCLADAIIKFTICSRPIKAI
ncbi:retinol dehydrogenase 16-like [Suncus etruscus]|uniref:retinol dehydrogenase 16-like n=1 Tax=Suncus etruscus TaxID=109475 RepID=UPI0021108C01|nr:retinol dehydrogenase 16-like [Suncus etruscus]